MRFVETRGVTGYALLVVAAALLPFAWGHDTIPLAAWLAPVFIMRYTRAARDARAWLVVWALLSVAYIVQVRGMVPLPLAGSIAIGALSGFGYLVPYVIDRLVVAPKSAFLGTLCFPCAVAALDFGISSLSPYGSWNVVGYSQYGDLPLMQFASVTGMYGISFVVSWFAAVVNWAWENGFDGHRIWRGLSVFVIVVAGVHVYGAARLLGADAHAHHERVAGVALDDYRVFPNAAVETRFWARRPLSERELLGLDAATSARAARLFAASAREADGGARLVFWSESSVWVFSNERGMLEEGAAFARRHHIFLGMAYLNLDRARGGTTFQNKIVLIDPAGRVLFQYLKLRPVPFSEQRYVETNGNPIGEAETPLGRVAAIICFDLDFPSLVRQTGRDGMDMLIVPSKDWPALDPWHTHMAVFRAIENGVNLVRNVSDGRSIAVDYLGRSIAQSDFRTSETIVADVPTRGVATPYAAIGDAFAWLCVGALTIMLLSIAMEQRHAPHDEPALPAR